MKNPRHKTLLAMCLFLFLFVANAQDLQIHYKRNIDANVKSLEIDRIIANLDRDGIKYQCDANTLAFSKGYVFLKRSGPWTKELYSTYELKKNYVNWSIKSPLGAYFRSVYFDFDFHENTLYSKAIIVNEYDRDITPDFYQLWDLMGKQKPNTLDGNTNFSKCVLLQDENKQTGLESNKVDHIGLSKVTFEGQTFSSLKEISGLLKENSYSKLEMDMTVWQKGDELIAFPTTWNSDSQATPLTTISTQPIAPLFKKHKSIAKLVQHLEKTGWHENKLGIFMSKLNSTSEIKQSHNSMALIYIDIQEDRSIRKIIRTPESSTVQIHKATHTQ
jgi:hypothetical protein